MYSKEMRRAIAVAIAMANRINSIISSSSPFLSSKRLFV